MKALGDQRDGRLGGARRVRDVGPRVAERDAAVADGEGVGEARLLQERAGCHLERD